MAVGLEIMSLIRTRRISAASPRRGQVSGAMPAALRVRNFRRTATRMTVSIGVAVLVVIATVVLALSTVRRRAAVGRRTDSTALILGGTSVPTPDNAYVETVKNHFIAPTHPGQDINYVAVTTPEEFWPITGFGPPRRARARAPERLGAWWPRVAGRAVVETLGALRPHHRSVGPGRGRRSGDGDGRARQRRSGDLRLLAGRDDRDPENASSPSSTRREPRPPTSTSCSAVTSICPTAAFLPVPGPLHSNPRFVFQRPGTDRHPVRHGRHHPPVRGSGRFPVVSAQCHLPLERGSGRRLRAPVRPSTSAWPPIRRRLPPTRAPTATPATTSSRPRTCRCLLRCAPWGCPSR